MRILLAVCSTFVSTLGFGQGDIQSVTERVVAPNIDATAVFKFANASADLANGMARVEVPLYNIQLKELNVPINLKYYSRGIKVSEIASSVGLGWGLNYGGLVSRQVRDKADDSRMGYLRHTYYKDMLNESIFKVNNLFSAFNTYPDLDLIPDRFFFSIGDFSGEFIFDQKSGAILQQSTSDIKIKAKFNTAKTIVGWEITDTKGNNYHFGVIQSTDNPIASSKKIHSYVGNNPLIRYQDLGESIGLYYDSWYLIKIESFYKEEVNFEYQGVGALYYAKDYDKKVLSGQSYQYETYYSQITENSYALSKIKFPLGIIDVKLKSETRLDLLRGKSIESISMSNYKNKLISKYTLHHIQKMDGADTKNTYLLLPSLDESSKYRMFLQSVDFFDSQVNKVYSYQFGYNSTPLPNRFSTSQDAWGLFNNANNGTTAILGNGTNLGVNNSYNGAGLLESITYPTGKTEKFIYEGNEVFQDPEKQTSDSNTRTVQRSVSVNVFPQARCEELSPEQRVGKCLERGNLEKTLRIPSSATGGIKIYFAVNKFQHADYGPIDCSYEVFIYHRGSPINPYLSGGPVTFLYPNRSNQASPSILQAGEEYTVKVSGPFDCSSRETRKFASCSIRFEWLESETIENNLDGLLIQAEG